MESAPEGMFPLTQDTAADAYEWMFAPWVKDLGLTDIVLRGGFASLRLPLQDKLKFAAGAVCGQALMAAIDTAAAMAAATGQRPVRGTIYQHTHFLRPASNDDFIVEANVIRFGKSSCYLNVKVTYAGSGALVADAVLEFAL